MSTRLLALTTAVLLFLVPLQPSFATMEDSQGDDSPSVLDLPRALDEDDIFDDLPFEQLRQALREEVERNPKKSF